MGKHVKRKNIKGYASGGSKCNYYFCINDSICFMREYFIKGGKDK